MLQCSYTPTPPLIFFYQDSCLKTFYQPFYSFVLCRISPTVVNVWTNEWTCEIANVRCCRSYNTWPRWHHVMPLSHWQEIVGGSSRSDELLHFFASQKQWRSAILRSREHGVKQCHQFTHLSRIITSATTMLVPTVMCSSRLMLNTVHFKLFVSFGDETNIFLSCVKK